MPLRPSRDCPIIRPIVRNVPRTETGGNKWHSDLMSNVWKLRSSIAGIEGTPDARPGWPAKH